MLYLEGKGLALKFDYIDAFKYRVFMMVDPEIQSEIEDFLENIVHSTITGEDIDISLFDPDYHVEHLSRKHIYNDKEVEHKF